MILDLFTTSFITGVVVVTAGVVFLLETVRRRESSSGRYWAASFLAGILVTFCYVVWTVDRDLWIATALGNATFVAQMGLLWMGCRLFNGRFGFWPRTALIAVPVAALAAAVLQRDAGDWAGAAVMFAGIGGFALLGAIESMRGELRAAVAARGLTFVLGTAAAYYLVRTGVFLFAGPQSAIFQTAFGTNVTSLVTIALTIVAVVSTSLLRVQSASTPAVPGTARAARGGLLPPAIFVPVLEDVLARRSPAGTPVAVIAVRVVDVGQIAAAFGAGTADRINAVWRDATRRHTPLGALSGALDRDTAAVVLHASSEDAAVSAANELRQRLIDELSASPDTVLPGIGVGVALTDAHGYDAGRMILAARDAAVRAASGAGVLVASA